MNKKAQFFIIAALIISGIILTFGKVYTSSTIEKEALKVYDLSNQIQYETSQVIDNGIFNEKSPIAIKEELKNLTAYYASLNPDSSISLLFGNSSDIFLIEYNLSSSKVIEVKVGAFPVESNLAPGASFEASSQSIKIKIQTLGKSPDSSTESKNIEHSLIIDSEQVFYIVIRKKAKGQDVIVYR